MEFKNRTVELERLNKMSASGKKEMLVLYGRRRLGKTTLLRQFARKKRALFFHVPKAPHPRPSDSFRTKWLMPLKRGGLPNPAEMRLGFANPNRATGEAGGLSDINGSDAKHGNEIRR